MKIDCSDDFQSENKTEHFISGSNKAGQVHHVPTISADAGRAHRQFLQRVQKVHWRGVWELISAQFLLDLSLLQLLHTIPTICSEEVHKTENSIDVTASARTKNINDQHQQHQKFSCYLSALFLGS